ncbi:MAG: phosphoribosylamine--glycine ligase, partial [FCB group bacterium]|nr:phosphoribosylamine--glycine ligase [FCB group bacterium]
VQGKLKQTKIKISPKTAVTVVLASAGYPGTYKKGVQIHGLEKLENDLVYHAGTAVSGNMSVTSGGRVLNVVGFGKDLPEAIADVYSIVGKIDFDGKYYRKDIGARGLKYLRNVR